MGNHPPTKDNSDIPRDDILYRLFPRESSAASEPHRGDENGLVGGGAQAGSLRHYFPRSCPWRA